MTDDKGREVISGRKAGAEAAQDRAADLAVARELGIPIVADGYGTIVADPPWSFNDKGSRAAPDQKGNTIYATLSPAEIMAIPVEAIAAERAHLYLWTTDSHLPIALDVCAAWGFAYKQTLVWVKRREGPLRKFADGTELALMTPLQIGMGHYYRHAHELCLFAVRGSLGAAVHDCPSVIEAPRRGHSHKPPGLRLRAERVSPGPRIELFATELVPAWAVWGDQLPHDRFGWGEFQQRLRARADAAPARRRAEKEARIRWGSVRPFHYKLKWGCRCGLCGADFGGAPGYADEAGIKVCSPCYDGYRMVDDARRRGEDVDGVGTGAGATSISGLAAAGEEVPF